MSTDGPANKPAPTAHVHGPHCAHCGAPARGVREYTLDDRFMQLLFIAVCDEMGVDVVRTKKRATFRVEGRDATLDQLGARVQTLLVQLDDQLTDVAEHFIREHTGKQIHRRAR